jgi:hypothetical protein
LAGVDRGVATSDAPPDQGRIFSPPDAQIESVNVPPLDVQLPRPPVTGSSAANVVNGPLFVAPQTR